MSRPALTIFSLLFALATAAAWYFSHRAPHGLALLLDNGRIWGVASIDGQVLLIATDIQLGPRRAWRIETAAPDPKDARDLRSALLTDEDTSTPRGRWGFAAASHRTDALGIPSAWAGAVAFPHWILIALTCLSPLAAVRVYVTRHRRARQGRCTHCGYDRRATVGKCPECGKT